MREIKFRAMTISGEWKTYSLGDLICGDAVTWEELQFNASSWSQYTGLKDKNGVEVYEGDIVKHLNTKGFDSLAIGVIEWDWTAKWRHSRYSEEYLSGNVIEVIGNIYQNPELLEQSHD